MGKHRPWRKPRAPNKLKSTESIQELFDGYLKPFLDHYTLHHEQRRMKEGAEAFFSVASRPVTWCKSREAFKMPGTMWVDTSHPTALIDGVGRRYVKPESELIVRLDEQRPDHNEIEFDEQVFVLTDAEFFTIRDHLRIRA